MSRSIHIAGMTNWTLLPAFWGATAWSTAVSVVNFVGGNVVGGLWHAFGAVQWSRDELLEMAQSLIR
ncbi:MAG: hypothetical protein MUF71_02765 [Candidatus Kapabacteria bacterium]|jgi:hypothetical protein|nr:hypothetical protein [Candidatus Kapabacteria bacterium]